MPITINGSNTPTAGGITYGDGTNYASTAAGTSGQVLTSAGSSAPTWTTPSAGALTLLANITPTAATTVQSLSVFTSTYDNYLIIASGISCATTGQYLLLRYAVAGVVDTAANYGAQGFYPSNNNSINQTNADVFCGAGTVTASSGGASFVMSITNANATNSTYKVTDIKGVLTGVSTSVFQGFSGPGMYKGTSAISGFQFYWNAGANFAAQGNVRVYGYANS